MHKYLLKQDSMKAWKQLAPERISATFAAGRRLLAIGCLLVAGCASQPLAYPIRAAGDRVINRDEVGNALSVVVRLYELNDRNAFSKLRLEDLSNGKRDEDLLGDELVNRTEVVVMPGQRSIHDAQLQPETRFVGVVAMFRQPDLDHWRYLIPADRIRSNSSGLISTIGDLFNSPGDATSGLLVTVRDCSIVILAPEPDLLPGQRPQRTGSCPAIIADDAGPTEPPARPASAPAGRPKAAGKLQRRSQTTSTIAGNN